MSEGREDSVGVLRRKVRSAGNSPAPVARAVRRAADIVLGLEMRVSAVQDSEVEVPVGVKSLPDPGLLVRYHFANSEGSLLFALDHGLVSAIGEQTTLGIVAASPPEPRSPSRVDMAMCAPFLEALLVQLAEEAPDNDLTLATRAAEEPLMISDLAEAEMILPDRPGALFQITLTAGGREGCLFVLVPEKISTASVEAAWRTKLDAAVLPARGSVEAILCRLPLTIERLKSLSVGDMIDVPNTAISQVSVEGPDGQTVATARLGQLDGSRAICLNPVQASGGGSFTPTGGGALEDPTIDLALPDMSMGDPEPMGDMPSIDLPDGDLPDLAGGGLPDLPDLPVGGEDEPLADLGQFGDLSDFDAIPGEAEDTGDLDAAPLDFAALGVEEDQSAL